MSAISINQNENQLVITSKAIDWLVNNTHVRVFNPISFDGYQRQIDVTHCQKIVDYLKKDSFLPTAIICACDGVFTEGTLLRIVDGQHRVRAFEMLRQEDPNRYDMIKNQQIPVIVMVGVLLKTEIQTFITINKTSKKVDTSLAYVLKNKLSDPNETMVMSRAEYIAVEAAKILNEDDKDDIWFDRILYEGNVKKSNCYISLNAFVKASRVLVNTIYQVGLIDLEWNSATSEEDVARIATKTADLIQFTWEMVYRKWPELRNASFEEKQVLQGAIGYTAITRTLVKRIRQEHVSSDVIEPFISQVIQSFSVPYYKWTKGGEFSMYSSESGYRFVSDALMK